MNGNENSTKALLAIIGSRIKRYRVNCDLQQKDIQNSHGVSISTIRRLEQGDGASLENFLEVLGALGLTENIEALIPEPGISPIQLAKLQGKQRQRAYGPRKKKHD